MVKIVETYVSVKKWLQFTGVPNISHDIISIRDFRYNVVRNHIGAHPPIIVKIKKLLIEGLIESNKQVAIRFEDLEKNLKKHKGQKDSKREELPYDNFFIFLSPGGEPILAYDSKQK